MVRELVVEQLKCAVGLAGCGEVGDPVVQVGLGLGPVPGDEGLFGRDAGSAKFEHGCAIGGGGGGDGDCSRRKFELVELNLDSVEGREVSAQAGVPARLRVGLKRDDAASSGAFWGRTQVLSPA